jgi:predicted amidophosphoribosyltransferase
VRGSRRLEATTPLAERGPAGVDLVIATAPFHGVARELVHGLKFGRRLGLARVAAGAISAAIPAGESGTVVPVPAAELRRRWRGFDPAEEIALELARIRGLPFARCLQRRHGPRQVGRPRAERLADPPRVRLRRPAPQAVLLVDDVYTTGATLGACAIALRGGGCERIVALAVARAL